MREVLFRGKSIVDDSWQYGSLIKQEYIDCDVYSQSMGCYIPYYCINTRNDKDWTDGYKNISVKAETIGQYTGLKDKNGTKIFEGDIIKGEYSTIYIVKYGRIGYDSSVGFTGFVLEEADPVMSSLNIDTSTGEQFYECGSRVDLKKLEVLGNIYENTDLLENID